MVADALSETVRVAVVRTAGIARNVVVVALAAGVRRVQLTVSRDGLTAAIVRSVESVLREAHVQSEVIVLSGLRVGSVERAASVVLDHHAERGASAAAIEVSDGMASVAVAHVPRVSRVGKDDPSSASVREIASQWTVSLVSVHPVVQVDGQDSAEGASESQDLAVLDPVALDLVEAVPVVVAGSTAVQVARRG